jgi:GTPase SAR1 family protein
MEAAHIQLIKLVIIGDESVGKSHLLLRYATSTFANIYIPTIWIDFKMKYIDVD